MTTEETIVLFASLVILCAAAGFIAEIAKWCMRRFE
jgi:hypothetical protein